MLRSLAYRRSPVRAQEALLSLRGALRAKLREGPQFASIAQSIAQSQWWSEEQWREFQSRTLRHVVAAAMRDVPWYRRTYGALDPDLGAGDGTHFMQRLPVIDKATVRTAGRSLLSRQRRGPLIPGSTSGTTGAPLTLHQDLAAVTRENAFIARQLEWAGLRAGDRRAWMRGDLIVPVRQAKPPFWRQSRAENLLMLSSYHLSAPAAAHYVRALEDFEPVVIQAYPSSIAFLAAWMNGNGQRYRGRKLRGVVTSSETLTRAARTEIEAAFGCPVFDWYGQFERVAAIGTCEHGGRHLMVDYSYVELVPAERGLLEIVGTGFNNFAMPLIRYRCGDLVRPAPAHARCTCGRTFPLVAEVLGRADDAVKLPDGRTIGRLDHIFKGVSGVVEAQIRQDHLDAVEIMVVPSHPFEERIGTHIARNARAYLGEEIAVHIHVVSSIPRAASGKFRGVVCNV